VIEFLGNVVTFFADSLILRFNINVISSDYLCATSVDLCAISHLDNY